jgi:hypothetical protein
VFGAANREKWFQGLPVALNLALLALTFNSPLATVDEYLLIPPRPEYSSNRKYLPPLRGAARGHHLY